MKLNKLPVKKLIEFRGMSEKSQVTFAIKLKTPKEVNPEDGGGDYWIRCTSGISGAFKSNDTSIITNKIEDVLDNFEVTDRNQTKVMYQRNLDILYNYEDFDFSIWRPSSELNFIKRKASILFVQNFPIQILPQHIFSFEEEGKQKIGAIWFVTRLEGYKSEELGMFTEAIYRLLTLSYGSDFEVDPYFCWAIDTPNTNGVSYSQILNGDIPSLFDSTIDKLAKYFK